MKSKWRHFNWILFGSMLALIVVGTLAIHSAGHAREAVQFHSMWKANLVSAGLGLGLYFVLAALDYRKLLDGFSFFAYVFAVLLLIAVLLFGKEVYGGQRWLWFFQPSEVAKVCVLAFVAWIFGGARGDWTWLGGLRGFLLACGVTGLPAFLILLEPDLGTTLTLLPAVLVMLFAARVWRLGLTILLAVGGLLALTLCGALHEAYKPGTSEARREAILRFVPLREHQVKRVRVFLFPEEDVTGAGYTLRQAKISIGSGGFSGKGFGRGETNHLKYLPQSISMNDFIFCVYAEETGFVGSLVLLSLFGALIVAGVWIAWRTDDGRGRLLALGVSTLIFAHVFVNIAMSIGMVPITGLPLPFISSGRTFLLSVMSGLGFVQSVAVHREERL